jgi:hypothetical protein
MKTLKQPLFYIETTEPSCSSVLLGVFPDKSKKDTHIYSTGDVKRGLRGGNLSDDDWASLWSISFSPIKTKTTDADFPFSSDVMRNGSLRELLDSSDSEFRRAKEFLKAVASHPQVECEYPDFAPKESEYTKRGIKYRIVIPEYEKEVAASRSTNVANASMHFLRMPVEMKRNVAYYYGFNADGASSNDLIVEFMNPILLADDAKISEFLKVFTNSEVMRPGISDIVVVKKAMLLSQENGVPFTFRNGSYSLGEEFIGNDVDTILAWLKARPGEFKALCADLKENITEEEGKMFLSSREVDFSAAASGSAPAAPAAPKGKGGKPKGVDAPKESVATLETKKEDIKADDDEPF